MVGKNGRIFTIVVGHAAHDSYTAFLPALLPLLVVAQDLSASQAGLLSVFLQAPWLLQPLLGQLADRGYARMLVVWAPALAGVMMSLLAVTDSYVGLCLLLMAAGLASASIHASAPALIGRLSGPRLGRTMGLWMVGGELGRTLGPVVVVAAVRVLSLEGLPWLMIGGLLVSAMLYQQLDDLPAPGAAAGSVPWTQVARRMMPLLVPLAGVLLARAFLALVLTLYLPLFLHQEGNAFWLAGIALAVVEGAGVAGALAGGMLSDRWGRRTVLALSLFATPLLVWLFLMASGWLRLPLLLLAGFSGLSTTPVILAMVQESQPGHRSVANGIFMVLAFAVRSLAVLLMGWMIDGWGMRNVFLTVPAFTLLGLALIPRLGKSSAR